MQENKFRNMKKTNDDKLGDQAPEFKHYLIVFGVIALLIAFGWISWYQFGWFH